MRPKYDMLWKGMMEEVVEDLLLFVEPTIDKDVDLKRGFEFLDKELAVISPEPDKTTSVRVVDKLVKIFLRDGLERWMLLHVEVQASNDAGFSKRMFQYYYRIVDRHDKPVAAIAVFTGRDGRNPLSAYEDRCLWMRQRYEYKTLCISDYPDEVLEASMNPFAAVMRVAKDALLHVRGTDEERDKVLYERKVLMVRLLKERVGVFGEKKTEAILSFLNNYVVFKKPETNRKFMEKTDQIFGKKNTMGIIEQLAEIKRQEGVEEGLEKGKEGSVRLFLANTEFSPEKIAKMVGVPVSFVKKVMSSLNSK